MKQQTCTRQQSTRVRSATAWAAVGSVVAAGTLFSGGAFAQEVLPTPPPPFKGQIGRTMPLRMSLDETFDVGEDTGTPVSEDYDVPFKFTGQIEKVVVHLGETKLGAADQQKLQDMERKAKLKVE